MLQKVRERPMVTGTQIANEILEMYKQFCEVSLPIPSPKSSTAFIFGRVKIPIPNNSFSSGLNHFWFDLHSDSNIFVFLFI